MPLHAVADLSNVPEATRPTARTNLGSQGTGDELFTAASPAAARTTLLVPASDPAGVTGADAVSNIISLTQAEYDAIGTKSATTLYVVT